ncbi:hypothetical protein WJX77_007368 [Trebouxia sp. C0004]
MIRTAFTLDTRASLPSACSTRRGEDAELRTALSLVKPSSVGSVVSSLLRPDFGHGSAQRLLRARLWSSVSSEIGQVQILALLYTCRMHHDLSTPTIIKLHGSTLVGGSPSRQTHQACPADQQWQDSKQVHRQHKAQQLLAEAKQVV